MISAAHDSWIYGTHLPPLMECLVTTTGTVLEIGCGEWSTPILFAYCLAARREFVSVDTDAGWAARLTTQTGMKIECPPDLYALSLRRWSVVLVDNDPAESRAEAAARFADCAEFVLIHDSENLYVVDTLDSVLDKWKYRLVYDTCVPNTLILSNTRMP
jgi:hypothetical protein